MAQVTAVVQVQSLAWELPHASGAAKKRKEKKKAKRLGLISKEKMGALRDPELGS